MNNSPRSNMNLSSGLNLGPSAVLGSDTVLGSGVNLSGLSEGLCKPAGNQTAHSAVDFGVPQESDPACAETIDYIYIESEDEHD